MSQGKFLFGEWSGDAGSDGLGGPDCVVVGHASDEVDGGGALGLAADIVVGRNFVSVDVIVAI